MQQEDIAQLIGQIDEKIQEADATFETALQQQLMFEQAQVVARFHTSVISLLKPVLQEVVETRLQKKTANLEGNAKTRAAQEVRELLPQQLLTNTAMIEEHEEKLRAVYHNIKQTEPSESAKGRVIDKHAATIAMLTSTRQLLDSALKRSQQS